MKIVQICGHFILVNWARRFLHKKKDALTLNEIIALSHLNKQIKFQTLTLDNEQQILEKK